MKNIKLFAGIMAFAAICACGNTKTEPQAQTAENTIEEVKEQGTVFYDITLEEALEKAKAEGKHVLRLDLVADHTVNKLTECIKNKEKCACVTNVAIVKITGSRHVVGYNAENVSRKINCKI